MLRHAIGELPVNRVWLGDYYKTAPHDHSVCYVIEFELAEHGCIPETITLLQMIAALVSEEGNGLPSGQAGEQYGASIFPDREYPIVRLSHQQWCEETFVAAQVIMETVARRQAWPILRRNDLK